MNFKPGDVCEVVDTCCPISARFGGLECTIVAPSKGAFYCDCGFHTRSHYRVQYAVPQRVDEGYDGDFMVPARFLRLKRPPSWDQWITDTSHVRDETPVEVPA